MIYQYIDLPALKLSKYLLGTCNHTATMLDIWDTIEKKYKHDLYNVGANGLMGKKLCEMQNHRNKYKSTLKISFYKNKSMVLCDQCAGGQYRPP